MNIQLIDLKSIIGGTADWSHRQLMSKEEELSDLLDAIEDLECLAFPLLVKQAGFSKEIGGFEYKLIGTDLNEATYCSAYIAHSYEPRLYEMVYAWITKNEEEAEALVSQFFQIYEAW